MEHRSFATAHGCAPFETTELSDGTQVLCPGHCVQGSAGAERHPALAEMKAAGVLLR